MQELLKLLYPMEDFEILEYKGGRNYIKIRCNKCNNIIEYADAQQVKQKKNLCVCTNYFKSTREKIIYLSKVFNYTILDDIVLSKVKCKCNLCKKEWVTNSGALMRGGACKCQCKFLLSIEQCQQQFDKKFGDGTYTLLTYHTKNTKASIRHNKCGFVWNQTPGHFLEGCGCPKCNRKRSRGETEIMLWLDNNKISYITQYSLKTSQTTLYLDFYLPAYNLAIEYQGEQHYHPIPNFGGYKGLQAQIRRDNLKKEILLKQNIELLEIVYIDLKQIPAILSSKLNDYRKSEILEQSSCKCNEVDNIEDIV